MTSVSPMVHWPKITFKLSIPIMDDNLAATQTSELPTKSDVATHHKPTAGTEPMQEPSVGTDEVCGGFLIMFLSLTTVSSMFAQTLSHSSSSKFQSSRLYSMIFTSVYLLCFSLGLLRTAYLPVMTTAQIAPLVMDSYLVVLYHMYDSDSFLGSL